MATLTDRSVAWLKQHSATERSFARALQHFFRSQALRVASEVSENFQSMTPEQVSLIFNAEDEHRKLLPIVQRNLAALMASGAASEMKAIGKKSFDAEYMERFDLSASDLTQQFIEAIPAGVRQRIRHALDELSEQPYWRKIQSNVRNDLASIIKSSLDLGETNQQLARRIRLELGGDMARSRAMAIARTEVTGCLNAGHEAVIADLAQSGATIKKVWLSIIDDSTRESHVNANGQTVPANGTFNVGGNDAPYPGHWSLPPHERIRCRCTVISQIDE